jgi:hypothetical protein
MNKPAATVDQILDEVIWDLDPDRDLRLFEKAAIRTGNPFYFWLAIDICSKNEKKQFPDWVNAYLGQCANRMMSDKAKQATDVRKILPWIFAFPKKKSGPGKFLDPYYGAVDRRQKVRFACKFAMRLYRGEDPVDARKNAGDEVFEEVLDDKTLQRYLLREFRLTHWPETTEEWKPVIDRYRIAMKAIHERQLALLAET